MTSAAVHKVTCRLERVYVQGRRLLRRRRQEPTPTSAGPRDRISGRRGQPLSPMRRARRGPIEAALNGEFLPRLPDFVALLLQVLTPR